MKRFDPRIQIDHFLGKQAILAPTSPSNTQKIRKLLDEMMELAKVTEQYQQDLDNITSDDRLKESTKKKRIKKLNEEFEQKAAEYDQDLVAYRKKICDVIVDEWVAKNGEDPEPDEDWYKSDTFDDWMLFRVVEFFLNPRNPTLSEKQ